MPTTRTCIYNWIKTRRLEAYVLAGGIRIDEVELADCISSLAPKQPQRSGICHGGA